jgi:hypothetical protein
MTDDGFTFTDAEKIGFGEMHALWTDDTGRDVLVGLTREETIWYMERSREWLGGVRRHGEEKRRWLALAEKHELARLAQIGRDSALRNFEPPGGAH